MPKRKINKKDAVTFQLVHRSQQDPLIADEEAPQRVLLPLKGNESKKNDHLQKQEYVQSYKEDDYLELDEDDAELHQNVTESKGVKFDLPSVVFPSEVEEEVGMLGKAAPVSGPQLHLDPDVVAAMDDDFDYSDPENQLEDNFIELANVARSEKEFDEKNSEDIDSDDFDVDDEGWNNFDKEETKSRFTDYSITSSAIRRNDQLRLLDEKFEKMFVGYEENEIGALDLEEIEGEMSSDLLLNSALDEFNKCQNLEMDKNTLTNNLASTEDLDLEDEELMPVESTKRKWDCESILSSYSNIYNHPKKIIEPKDNKIQISKKTGIPNVWQENGLTSKTLEKLNQANERDVKIDSKSIPDQVSQLSILSQRPKHETYEDKKNRKHNLKEYRKERRVEKKMNREAFKDETKRQVKIAINNRNNVQGNKIL